MFKDDFQAVLRTLESLFMFFFVLYTKYTLQNVNISQLLTPGKFNRDYEYEASFFLKSVDETNLT